MWFLLACQAKPQIEEQFSLKDLTPPQVISILPENGATEVIDKPTIVVVFNEPMDPATLNSSTVTVKTANGTPGVGSYEYDATNNALTIKIVQNLYLNTQYTITVTSQVKDRAGNAITPVTSTFSTDVCPKARRGKPVFNSTVKAIAKLGCTLYVGGNFTQVGEAGSYGMAFDTATGQRAASFTYEDINGTVHAVAADGNGGFYIGGDFTRVGNYPRNRLAHIAANGEVLPWNPGANSTVSALAVSGSTVYAGGLFTTIGGNPRNRLAAIGSDGSLQSWNPDADGAVYAIASAGGNVYVGGAFNNIGGVSRGRLAAISNDGTLLNWNPGVGGSGPVVYALAVSGSTIYVGGYFFSVSGNTRPYLAAVDIGASCLTSYTPACVPSWNPYADNQVNALAVSGGIVYVGGSFTCIGGVGCPNRNRLAAIGTDGTLLSWNPNVNLKVSALAVLGNTVYAGGDFTTIDSNPRNRLAAIDISSSCLSSYTTSCLTSWNPNANFWVLALAASGSAVYAGGYFTMIGATSRNRLAALSSDGTLLSWNPNADNIVEALAASGSTIYVGGGFTNISSTARNRLAAIGTDGTLLSWNPNANSVVYALVVSGSTVYAGGGFTTIGASARNYLAAIGTDGTLLNWDPNASNYVETLALANDTIYAGGHFTTVGGSSRNHLAAIDTGGTCLTSYAPSCLLSWNPDANGIVYALAVSGSTIYAGGAFGNVGGVGRSKLAALDISATCLSSYAPSCLLAWNPGATGGLVYGLAASASAIYAGGTFTTIGGNSRDYLAAMGSDGTLLNWSLAPANGAPPRIEALFFSGSTIYAGGDFTTVNGNPHFYFTSINSDGTVNW